MNFIFLSGILFDYDEILKNSHTNVQNAANVLQSKFLDGFIQNDEIKSLDVINLPYLGSYPKYYKKCVFRTELEYKELNSKATIYNVSFNNISIIKNFSRFILSFLKSYKIMGNLSKNLDKTVFIVYAMHLPFLMTAFCLKKFFPQTKFYVIIPDLPEYMSNRKGIASLFFKIISKISYLIVNNLDGVVILTEQMKSKFSPSLRSVVVEGISSNNDFLKFENEVIAKQNFFLYSGTLDNRYGLKTLIDSFNQLSSEDETELYICGDGPDKKTILKAVEDNPKIKYFGLLPREEVLILQKKAKLLINPRNDKSEFTKYSFPSKTLEYMSSGTPVLMYKLSGMPEEYFNYLYTVEDDTSFTNQLVKLSQIDSSLLKQKGEKARNFVDEYKNPKFQVKKILNALG